MIFVTVGSAHFYPFHRLMDALEALPPDDLYVQHGPAEPPPCHRADRFLPFGEVKQLIERADVVISHAGVGSIMCALQAGHVPIVFPRLKERNETLDDHQVELADALGARGTVITAWTPAELADAVAAVPPRGTARQLQADRLVRAVRAAVRGDPIATPNASRIELPWRRRRALNDVKPIGR